MDEIEIFFISFFLILVSQCSAQKNLVFNPSFEQYRYCRPYINSTIDSFQCKGWWSPDDATPDYYNRCNKDHDYDVPENSEGYCEPEDGDAYVGIVPIKYNENLVGYMEHIQGHLISPLLANHSYMVSFYVRLAYKASDYIVYNIGLYLSENIILQKKNYISLGNYLDETFMGPNLKASISNPMGNFLADTSWTKISGTYRARGGEKYITIGSFWDDTPEVVEAWNNYKADCYGINPKFGKIMNKYMVKPNSYLEKRYDDPKLKYMQHCPYYFIDNVSVVDISDTLKQN